MSRSQVKSKRHSEGKLLGKRPACVARPWLVTGWGLVWNRRRWLGGRGQSLGSRELQGRYPRRAEGHAPASARQTHPKCAEMWVAVHYFYFLLYTHYFYFLLYTCLQFAWFCKK